MTSLLQDLGQISSLSNSSLPGWFQGVSLFTSLQDFWLLTVTHLWQSTLILVGLALAAWLARSSSSRLQHMFWSLALIKFFLPFPLFQKLGTGYFAATPSDDFTRAAAAWLDPIGVSTSSASNSPAQGWLTLLTVCWAAITLFLFVKVIRDWKQTRAIVNSALPPSTAGRLAPFGSQCVESKLATTPIRITEDAILPSAVGLRRGSILLPRRIKEELSAAELQSVLLHERAHLDRGDLYWTLLQRLAFALFFYFPPLWIVLSQLRRTSELACDEAVVRAGVDPTVLARALARTLRLRLADPGLATTFATQSRSVLSERLHRLDQPRRYVTMRRHRLILGIAGLSFSLFTLFAFIAPSADAEGEKVSENTTTSTSTESAPKTDAVREDATQPPKPVQMIPAVFPEEAKATNGGKVLLKAVITKEGKVASVEVMRGVEGCDPCAENAVTALKQWTFEPATQDGVPVRFEVVVPFVYAHDEDRGHEKHEKAEK